MLRQLFFRSDALTRQLSAPLVDERGQYLAHCAAQGMSRSTLRAKARLLLSIARHLRLAERSRDTISLPEIERAATRWSGHNRPSIKTGRGEFSKQYFITEASRWPSFLNRLHLASESVTAFDGMVAAFRNFDGVTRNDQLAFFWQKKAAMQGHPCDQRHLGLMYEHGIGVERDPDAALLWYQKAANQGGYFERSQITELQTRVIGNQIGHYKRPADPSIIG